ncbi:MAG: hypothetical protein JNL83_29470 [Myxococcales bacterium]|nr:hypothetical protein [Myxococcales bacterium]
MVRVLWVVAIVASFGCGGEKKESPGGGSSGAGAGPTRETAAASCASVLMTRPATPASSTLSLQLDGKPFPIALDAAASYPKNPVWDGGAAPAACGLVKDGKANLVVQLHDHGTPVLRLQFLGAGADARKGFVAMLLEPGASKADVVSIKSGTITMSPDPPAVGEIKLVFADVTGELLASKKPVTISGELTVTLQTR